LAARMDAAYHEAFRTNDPDIVFQFVDEFNDSTDNPLNIIFSLAKKNLTRSIELAAMIGHLDIEDTELEDKIENLKSSLLEGFNGEVNKLVSQYGMWMEEVLRDKSWSNDKIKKNLRRIIEDNSDVIRDIVESEDIDLPVITMDSDSDEAAESIIKNMMAAYLQQISYGDDGLYDQDVILDRYSYFTDINRICNRLGVLIPKDIKKAYDELGTKLSELMTNLRRVI